MTTDPNALMQAAACYRCIPGGMQNEVIIYILAQMLNAQTGAAVDPATLMANAACFKCVPMGTQSEVMTYLLAQLATAVGA